MSTSEPLRDQLIAWVSDTKIDILYRGRTFLSIGISDDGTMRAAAPHFSDIEWSDSILTGIDYRLLDVLISYKEPTTEPVSRVLPRRTEQVIDKESPSLVVSAPRRDAKHHGGGAGVDSIAEHPRDQVLNAILDTFIDDPAHVSTNNKAKRVAYTKAIADKHNQRFFAVAGVRAALTKGMYGELDWLLDQRRAERKQLKQIHGVE